MKLTRAKIFYSILGVLVIIYGSYLYITHTKVKTMHKEQEIPPTEDLMREHGILNRVLLIYDEIIRRIENSQEFSLTPISQAVDIIKTFIEDYHEKLEEEYIFPLFEKKKVEVALVKTLRRQHIKGREITAQLKELLNDQEYDQKTKKLIARLLKKFITMYRPHEAREDTVLFPQVRSLISEKEFKEMGDYFEESENKLFGKNGFESILEKVVNIEKELGIYTLEQFTP